METLIDAIVGLFEIILIPFEALRELENDSWFLANAISWLSILVLVVAVVYWMKQLKEYDKDEDKTQTGHSFLG
jgi:branched-subunit amino acid transport protein AzlD